MAARSGAEARATRLAEEPADRACERDCITWSGEHARPFRDDDPCSRRGARRDRRNAARRRLERGQPHLRALRGDHDDFARPVPAARVFDIGHEERAFTDLQLGDQSAGFPLVVDTEQAAEAAARGDSAADPDERRLGDEGACTQELPESLRGIEVAECAYKRTAEGQPEPRPTR